MSAVTIVSGFVAATVDTHGVVYEYTDPMPTRHAARRELQRRRSWLLSASLPVRTTRVTCHRRVLARVVEGAWRDES